MLVRLEGVFLPPPPPPPPGPSLKRPLTYLYIGFQHSFWGGREGGEGGKQRECWQRGMGKAGARGKGTFEGEEETYSSFFL